MCTWVLSVEPRRRRLFKDVDAPFLLLFVIPSLLMDEKEAPFLVSKAISFSIIQKKSLLSSLYDILYLLKEVLNIGLKRKLKEKVQKGPLKRAIFLL